jgi:hypothetical protein
VDFISEGYCLRLYGLKTVAALFYVFFFLFSFYFSFFRSFSSLSISGRLVFVTSVFLFYFFTSSLSSILSVFILSCITRVTFGVGE